MNRRKVRRLGGMVLLWILGMAVILGLMPREYWRSYGMGYALACALAIVMISMLHQHLLPQLRRMPFYAAVGAASLLYMGAIVVSSAIGMLVFVRLTTRSPVEGERDLVHFFNRGWEVTLGIPFLIAVGILFLVELSRRIGPGRLVSLLLGRYRNPREETRILLFLDLSGSTSLAERFGSLQYSRLLRDFFDDLTEPVLETGGEIVEYVGDEAIVSWRFRPGRAADALRCFDLFEKRIEGHAGHYRQTFGLIPNFKAALHAGPVVATEIGQVKTQVVLHGDALNTASRVLAQCHTLEARLLATANVVRDLGEADSSRFDDAGPAQLRGKWEPVNLYRLRAPERSMNQPSSGAELVANEAIH